MKKKYLLILLVLLSFYSTFGQTATEIAKNAIQSTVSIIALDNNTQPLGFGSGFIIGKEERIVHTTGRLESHAENALKKYYLDKGFHIVEKTGFYFKMNKIK